MAAKGIDPVTTRSLDRSGLISVLLGLGLAIVIFSFSTLGTWVGHYFMTVCHEFGHALSNWLYGYPSLPALDFQYGGGVALHQDRKLWLLIIPYLGLAVFAAKFAKNLLLLAGTLVIIAIYSITAFTTSHRVIILFMGHGMELVIAGIFMYRALSGSAVIEGLERPLYAILGFFMVFYDARFAWLLLTDKVERIMYGFGKGGDAHDFTVIAEQYLHLDLRLIAGFFLVCCLATPLISFLVYRYLNGGILLAEKFTIGRESSSRRNGI